MSENILDELIQKVEKLEHTSDRRSLALDIVALLSERIEFLPEHHVFLIDSLLQQLIEKLEDSACSAIAERLALIDLAPIGILGRLAHDSRPAVFTPVLINARGLVDSFLTDFADSAGEAQLLAIAGRATLVESVTDALIRRALPPVLHRVAINPGARINHSGFCQLVEYGVLNTDLALAISARNDLPKNLLLSLIARAPPECRSLIEGTVRSQTRTFRESASLGFPDRTEHMPGRELQDAALAECIELESEGALNEGSIASFAAELDSNRVCAALAVLGRLELAFVHHAFHHGRNDSIIVLCRALDLAWSTMRAILVLRSGRALTTSGLESAAFAFERLNPKTARMALTIQRKRSLEAHSHFSDGQALG